MNKNLVNKGYEGANKIPFYGATKYKVGNPLKRSRRWGCALLEQQC